MSADDFDARCVVVFSAVSSAPFAIGPALFEQGELDEEAADVYERDLTRLFMESPEGKELEAEGVELGSIASIIHYGLRYQDVTVADMTAEVFDTVLYEVIPRKVMVQPDEAGEIVREARAFWVFLGREYGLEHAAACAAVVAGDRAVARLQRALGNPRSWGMAKSLMMEGASRGFDISSKAGIDRWIAAQNADAGLPRAPADAQLPAPREEPVVDRRAAEARRRKRKLAKASRRKNR